MHHQHRSFICAARANWVTITFMSTGVQCTVWATMTEYRRTVNSQEQLGGGWTVVQWVLTLVSQNWYCSGRWLHKVSIHCYRAHLKWVTMNFIHILPHSKNQIITLLLPLAGLVSSGSYQNGFTFTGIHLSLLPGVLRLKMWAATVTTTNVF